jgi:formylmethanofuran dehydrogenase subunit E
MEENMNEKIARAWTKAVDFHGHSCPGLAIGVRIALDYLEDLKIERAGDEELAAVAETDACAVDGLQAILGCTAGKGNLWLRRRGKHVFTIYQRASGQGRRYYWQGDGRGELSREERTELYLRAPRENLYQVSEARWPLPPEASILESRPCRVCGELTAEPGLRLREGQVICLDCYGLPLDLNRRIVL